ncbi:MAG: hypothetical protein IKO36_09365 [Bacteroidaceae bacterium]|nr:hypothetical protein [Bacteroidaceae bacterium]
MNTQKTMKVLRIDWDLDGVPAEEKADILANLPETIEVGKDFDGDIANLLSDEYGYCVNSLSEFK